MGLPKRLRSKSCLLYGVSNSERAGSGYIDRYLGERAGSGAPL
jgi:hypothetical protein